MNSNSHHKSTATPEDQPGFYSDSWKPVVLLLLLALVLYFANLGGISLWGKDEFRYAEVAQEILRSGNWFVLHLNNRPYPDKPPLYFWVVALLSLPRGQVTAWTARLPLAIAGVAGVLLTYILGTILFNRRKGFWSALILMVAGRYYWGIRWIRLDLPLVAFMFGSMGCFVYLYFERKKASGVFAWLFWFFLGCALLVKGPPVLVIPAMILVFLWIQKDWKFWGKLKWFPGFLIPLFMLLVWMIPAMKGGGKDYSQDMIWDQIAMRIFHSWRHRRPLPYYFYKLFGDFQPWALLLPPALWYAWKQNKKGVHKRELTLLWCWFLCTIIPFSLVPGKRGAYILPLYPALAMFVAYFLLPYFDNKKKVDLKIQIPLIILGVAFSILCIGGLIYPKVLNRFDIEFRDLNLTPIIVLFLVTGIGILVLVFRRAARASILALFCFSYLILLTPFLMLYPNFVTDQPIREITRLIMTNRKPGDMILMPDAGDPRYLLYADYYIEEIPSPQWLIKMDRKGGIFFAVLEDDDLDKIPNNWKRGRDYQVLYEAMVEDDYMLLITNQNPENVR